jgi:predicted component of type VI protein secretion system
MIVRFHVLSPRSKQRSFSARLPLLLGRGEEANFRIQHDLVSRRHCEFFARDGRVFLHDLGSTNGTFLDDEQVPVSTKTAVPPGAVVRVGGLSFRVDYKPSSADAAAGLPMHATGDESHDDPDRDPEESRVAGPTDALADDIPDFDLVAPANAETEPMPPVEAVPAAAGAAVVPPAPVAPGEPPAAGPPPFLVPEPDPSAAAPWAALEAAGDDAAEAGADADDPDDGPDDDKLNEFFKGLK